MIGTVLHYILTFCTVQYGKAHVYLIRINLIVHNYLQLIMVVSFYFASNLYCDIFDYYYKHMYTLYMAVRSVCFISVNLLILTFYIIP